MKCMGITFERVQQEGAPVYRVSLPPEEDRQGFTAEYPCTPTGWEEAWTVFISLLDSKGRRLSRYTQTGK